MSFQKVNKNWMDYEFVLHYRSYFHLSLGWKSIGNCKVFHIWCFYCYSEIFHWHFQHVFACVYVSVCRYLIILFFFFIFSRTTWIKGLKILLKVNLISGQVRKKYEVYQPQVSRDTGDEINFLEHICFCSFLRTFYLFTY